MCRMMVGADQMTYQIELNYLSPNQVVLFNLLLGP